MTEPDRRFFGHPRGLAFIVFTGAWERFSFYGMQALLMLYMVKHLLQPGSIEKVSGLGALRSLLEAMTGPLSTQAFASLTFGIYVAMVYVLPIFGGLAGDRVLGQRRAVILGAVAMALGHFLMAFETAYLYALLALIVGSGLLKGNLVAQVGQLYGKGDARRSAGFSMYAVSINIGAVIGPLVCGTLGEKVGWHYGFTAAGIGMLIGLAIYLAGSREMPADQLTQRERIRLQPEDWRPIKALFVMFLIHTLYWIAQTQVWNTYPLWIESRVSRHVLGWEVPVTWFQSLDSFTVLALAPIVIWLWRRQAQRGVEPGDLGKIAIGCAFFGTACLALFMGERLAGTGQVALLWPVLFHLVCALGYLFVFPVALALFSRTAPPSVNGMMAGVCYLSLGVGSVISGWLGRFYEMMTPGNFWLMHGIIVGTGTVLLLLLRGPLGRALESSNTRALRTEAPLAASIGS